MRKTYKDADKVLVLDSAITEVSSQTHDATEMVVRLKASSWVRRLWTFHEAYLARELHYQFKDGALRLSAILEKYHQGSESKLSVDTLSCAPKCYSHEAQTHHRSPPAMRQSESRRG